MFCTFFSNRIEFCTKSRMRSDIPRVPVGIRRPCMKHQSLIGLIVFLLSTPAFAHVVGVKHSLPPAPEYKRILEEPVTLYQAIKMHRDIQEARDKRTGVKTEVYAAQTTKSAFQELGVNYCQRRVHRVRGKRSQSCKWGNSIQSARNKRTGVRVCAKSGRFIYSRNSAASCRTHRSSSGHTECGAQSVSPGLVDDHHRGAACHHAEVSDAKSSIYQ